MKSITITYRAGDAHTVGQTRVFGETVEAAVAVFRKQYPKVTILEVDGQKYVEPKPKPPSEEKK